MNSAQIGSNEDNVVHYTGIRMRVVGSGQLKLSFFNQDSLAEQVLTPFTLAAATNIRPFRLANVIEQRAMLKGKTTELNEVFNINKIIIFAKNLYTSYPA